MKFETVAMEWFENKRKFLKESTEAYYILQLRNYILPEFSEIEDLNEEAVQKIVYKWQTVRNKQGTIIRKSTVANLVVLIRQIAKYAIKKKYLPPFDLAIAYLHDVPGNDNKTFAYEEQDTIIEAVMADLSFKSFGILLSLNTGIRIGELCALRWSDVDRVQNTVTIQNTLQRVYNKDAEPKTKIIIGNPKTLKSARYIPLSKTLQNAIRQLPFIDDSGYILTNTSSFMEPRTFRRFYEKFLLKHDIGYMNFHCLRHSFATRLVQNGADYKCVSELLGHTNINTTMNMYVHPDLRQKRNCIELF